MEDGSERVCPFVDQGDPRCGAHLTLRNIESAYLHCADRYMTCPVFQELLVEGASCTQAETRDERILALS